MNGSNELLTHHYAVKLADYIARDNQLRLVAEDSGKNPFDIVLSFYENGIVKIRTGRKIALPEYDFVSPDSLRQCDISITDSKEEMKIEYGSMKAVIGKEPFSFRIEDEKGRVVYRENFHDVDSVGEGEDLIPPMGFTTDSSGNAACVNICASLRYDEHIYGLGERFSEFDRRGQHITLQNADTLGYRNGRAYKNIPFYLSSYGYGLFLNTHLISEYDIGCKSVESISVRVPGESLEYYILTGGDLKSILANYMKLTGPAVLPPDWSFGLWYSTGFKGNSQENTLSDAERLRKEKIPCDVMHFDCYWMRDDMWCDFVWDEKFYPDRKGMLRALKENGFKICLWINPYVTIKTDMFKEGSERGYFVKKRDGSVYTTDLWHGLLSYCAFLDFTNPEAVKWYQQKAAALIKEGVDILKTDFGEDIPLDSVFSNGKTGAEMHNVYSRLYSEAVFSMIERLKGKGNAVVWGRSGYTGMQKFPVCWSGDPRSSFASMAATLRGGLSLALSGVPFWSHDMGGFYGDVSEEVFIRWSQFGLFSSHCRFHGTTTRQPWAFGKRAQAIVTDFIRLRYKLMPYILKAARKCVAESVPFLRPLVLEHPEDPAVCQICDEYYFGGDILVAPVFGGDNALRRVYLPEGEWRGLFTQKDYSGKAWYSLTCPLEYMPVFVKKGAEIPMNRKEIYYMRETSK